MRLLFLILLLPMASCSTYMENKIGQEFKSIQPDFTNVMQEDKSLEGAVYNGRGGLFASDVRANNVGDIITVKMEESMTAANSGSETTTKKDSYTFDLPEALFGPSSFIGKFLFNGWADGLVAMYFGMSAFLMYILFIIKSIDC